MAEMVGVHPRGVCLRGALGDFVLPEHEATLRLTAADRILEHVGLRTRLFAPPRWMVSPGALAALARGRRCGSGIGPD